MSGKEMDFSKLGSVRRNAPQPLYLQLVQRLSAWMEQMGQEGQDALPSERELCRLFSVSHTTVRLALKELEVSGRLLRVPGKGTFLSGRPAENLSEKTVYGVVLEELSQGGMTDFRLRLLQGASREAMRRGVSLMFLGQEDGIYRELCRAGRLSGLLIANPMMPVEILRDLRQMEIPLVTVGRSLVQGLPCVDNDNVAVGEAMTEHLLSQGCQRVGFIGLEKGFTVTIDRLAGYKRALKRHGLTATRSRIFFQKPGEKAGYQEAKHLLEAEVDGIVCMDDLIAMGVLHCLHESSVPCPEKVAVVGCNNSSFAEYSFPPLTSVDIQAEEIGAEAIRRLEALHRGEDDEREGRLLSFHLRERESGAKRKKK
ncbi:MAG: substrate-binding domain-containing protein [Oligosphaeraceae bacterium]